MTSIDYSKLLGMSQEDAVAYLNSIYSGQAANLENVLVDDANRQYQNYYNGAPTAQRAFEFDAEGNPVYSEVARLTNVLDPNYEGGQYGAYYSKINNDGTLGDAYFDKAQRHKGFIGENMDWLGPLMVLGPAAFLAAPEIAAAAGATGASEGLTAAQIADLGAISGATNAGAGAAFESALANSAFGAAGATGAYSGGDVLTDLLDVAADDVAFDPFAAPPESGGGLFDSLGKLVGSKGAMTALGGGLSLLNSLSSPKSQTITQQRTVDPRIDALMFGAGNGQGLIGRWQEILNRPIQPGLNNAFSVANKFFGA